MTAIYILMVIMSVPITGIVAGTYLQIKKLSLKQGLTSEDKSLLMKSLQENNDLKSRVENLENIITSMDKEILALYGVNPKEDTSTKVKQLVNKIKEQKGDVL